jgi:hypothetical protein
MGYNREVTSAAPGLVYVCFGSFVRVQLNKYAWFLRNASDCKHEGEFGYFRRSLSHTVFRFNKYVNFFYSESI